MSVSSSATLNTNADALWFAPAQLLGLFAAAPQHPAAHS